MSLYYPTFYWRPDFTTDPVHSILATQDVVKLAPSESMAVFPDLQNDHVFAFGFALTDPVETDALFDFFRDRAGRCFPFYVPSWRRDLEISQAYPAGFRVPILYDGYAEDHLDEAHEDHYGRQIFVWSKTGGLFVDRVVRVTEGITGEEILEMASPCPFPIDPETCLCGYVHLCRFMEDRLQWRFMLPSVATLKITFRGIRQWTQNEQENDVESLDQYGSLGFLRLVQTVDLTEPLNNRAGYSLGPQNLHYTQDAAYSTRWAVWPASSGVRLKRVPTGEVIFPDETGTNSALFVGTVASDHFTLCFDQNAYEVIAYQKTASTIELRHFFNGVPTTHGWTGIDPICVYNGDLDGTLETEDTDVVCYYTKPGTNVLFSRFQRDNFEDEYIAALLPAKPLALKRAYVNLDREMVLEFLDEGLRKAELFSDIYPEPPPDPDPEPITIVEAIMDPDVGKAGPLSISGGEYLPAIVWADGGPYEGDHPAFTESSGAGPLAVSGSYDPAVLTSDAQSDTGGAGPLALTGAYTLGIITADPQADVGSAGPLGITGTYAFYVLETSSLLDNAGSGPLALSGVYELA